MPERQSRHPDNDLIDQMEDAPAQSGSSGGEVARKVGKRAEESNVTADQSVERVTGEDRPARDEQKGGKALSQMQGGG